jgi:hypothetical protein
MSSSDAGTRDAATSDGNGVDATAPDGGAVDAGVRDAGPVADAGLPTWLGSVPPLQWTELPNTRVGDPPGYGGICAYSGGAIKKAGSQIFVWGGGHFDGDGNQVVALRLQDDVPTWTAVSPESTVKTPGGPYNPDGRPSARHTYGDLQFNDTENKLMSFACSIPADYSSQAYLNNVDAFHPDTQTWDPAGTYSNTAYANGVANVSDTSCQDSTGVVYVRTIASSHLLRWVPGTTVLEDTGVETSGGGHQAIACDTKRHRLVTFGTPSYQYDIGGGLTHADVSFSGPRAAMATASLSWVYVPERDSFLGIEWETDPIIFECDASSFSIDVLQVIGSPPSTSGSGGNGDYYGRFGYAPELRLMYWVPDATQNVWVFRVL